MGDASNPRTAHILTPWRFGKLTHVPLTFLSMAVRMVGRTGMMAPVMRCKSTNRNLQGERCHSGLHAVSSLALHTSFSRTYCRCTACSWATALA